MRRAVVSASAAVGVSLAALAGGAGCTYPALPKIAPRETLEFHPEPARAIDLLFLIDDSPSMADKQTNLASSFPKFIDTLSALPGGLPDLHIGVATSDLGTRGSEDAAPGPPVGVAGQGLCSGLGKNGILQTFGAPIAAGGTYISDIAAPGQPGVRVQNYTGTLSDVFAQIARGAGAAGCGFEQHLEAIKLALSPTTAANQGFLRPDAYLGVIIIADEDDCSMSHNALISNDPTATVMFGPLQSFRCTRFGVECDTGGQNSDAMNQIGSKAGCHPADDSQYLTKVADYAAFLTGLKQDPTKVFVAALVGPTDPFATELRPPPGSMTAIPQLAHSCSYLGGDITGDGVPDPEVADPAVRIKALIDAFGDRGAFSTICQQDLSGGVEQFGNLVMAATGVPCLTSALADADPHTPGTQYDCAVTAAAADGANPAALPACTPADATATNPPCWHVSIDPTSCPAADHVRLVIEGSAQLPADAHVDASCAVQPPA